MNIKQFTTLSVLIGAGLLGFTPMLSANDEGRIASGQQFLRLPESVPQERYTPHGYLDNPYHSMVFNRSGVIRSVPPLGMAFWKRPLDFPYGAAAGDHVNYLSALQMGVIIDKVVLLDRDDFLEYGIDLYSSYHSKNMMRYDMKAEDVDLAFNYILADENLLVCRVELENLSENPKTLQILASNIYGLWQDKWWGSNGLNGKYDSDIQGFVNKIWAYGDVFTLISDLYVTGRLATGDTAVWKEWQKHPEAKSVDECIIKGRGPLHTTLKLTIDLASRERKTVMVYLVRTANRKQAIEQIDNAPLKALEAYKEKFGQDQQFWKECPQLTGDWPQHWKHGWVYDWETLRMNVRQPIGIFKHPWDGMQIQSPRLVLGETAIDMFALSYADMELAKEVLYGTFADAVMDNVPCVREDGSMNMIGADGSECGTAPMWGFPFHVMQSVFHRSDDRQWLSKIYPQLKAYLDWWLIHRTDGDGWFHCNNSWESGQDGSRRFLVEGEGDPATFVRTVDVEASMAEAFNIMHIFADILGQSEDTIRWKKLARRHSRHTRSMFVDGWYRDIDGRNGQPIILEDFYDPIMLAPFTCRLADSAQIAGIRSKLQYILENPKWLAWPPKVLAYTEAAAYAGVPEFAGDAITAIADRIYRRTDFQHVTYRDPDHPYRYRIPGIACEYWPVEQRPAGGEAYGWGATLPLFIIRHIVGFGEEGSMKGTGFYLQPEFSQSLLKESKHFGITNLHYRDLNLDVKYTIEADQKIEVVLNIRSIENIDCSVKNESGQILAQSAGNTNLNMQFKSRVGQKFYVNYTIL
ncbi:MAG: hypothetical protein GF313_10630 [Caldithrix sp.]|nr:hypothetical protein [Caldithrix sp.]